MFKVSKLAPYAKAVVAFAGFVLLIAKAFVDGVISVDELQEIGIALGVALGVFQVKNVG